MNQALSLAERTLRPNAAQALEAWRFLVTAEREQVERLPNRPRPEDFYAPVAERFRADPYRTGEPLLERLLSLVRPGETWLDLGAGGGRYALPLATRAREVYAVEPSEGMLGVLTAAAREHGITNLRLFRERWPCESAAPVADVGFISQVGYDIAEIGPFLEQLEAHSSRLCVAVLFEQAPISMFAPLWLPVHGEERVRLPGLGAFVALLYARGRPPQIEMLSLPPRGFASLEALHAAARRPLWVLAGSDEDRRLDEALKRLAVATESGFTLDAQARGLGVVSWPPRP